MASNNSSGKLIIKAASACVWRGEEVLLIRRSSALGRGRWSLPGGKVEPGETTHAAAHRELMEEAGVAAKLDHPVGRYEIDAGDVIYVIECFCGPWDSGVATAGTDADMAEWLHFSEVQSRSLAPNILEAIISARRILGI
jgi:8-oxo-dGTP diphosphatase